MNTSSSKTNHYGMKTTETDPNCSLFQGTGNQWRSSLPRSRIPSILENQILLNSSADLPAPRKDHRMTNPNTSDQSFSRYHLVNSPPTDSDEEIIAFLTCVLG